MVEYPDDVVIKFPAAAGATELASVLLRLHSDEGVRKRIGERARAYVKEAHHPAVVGEAFVAAIESFYRNSHRHLEQELLGQMSRGAVAPAATELNLRRLAESVSKDLPFPTSAQIFCDVTAIADIDLRTGIERVTRGILNRLIEQPPDGYRVEPVLIRDEEVQYARRFTEERLQLPLGGLEDSPVEAGPRDHYVVMGWIPEHLPRIEPWLQSFRRGGGTVTVVIYDLLPLDFPHFFPDWIHGVTMNWVRCVLRTADRIACISSTVAQDVRRYGKLLDVDRTGALSIDHFPLGFDVQASIPSSGTSAEAEQALLDCAQRPTFLIVGTVEPRKGHEQVLKAFELLWERGLDVGLIIVGKEGWMVHEVVSRIRENQERTSHLIWLREASDEVLSELYDLACALLAASFGEGFGLPLIEAASHGLPIIARNIPVFREVAGEHAFYFEGLEPEALATRLQEWLKLYHQNLAPPSHDLVRYDWQTSTAKLLDIMFSPTSTSNILQIESSFTAAGE
jgi:glycosyltransferase involved in cell wall biosynthesis